MPHKICAGCRRRPATYRGRCNYCAKTREREIDRSGRLVYSTKRWRIARARQLSTQPFCERCLNEGREELATEVHHRTDLADGGDPYAGANLESICHSCHSRETRQGQLQRTK